MIKINFLEPDNDDWRAWRERCREKQQKHSALIEAGQEVSADSAVYGGTKETVYVHPDGPFHGKCAYCERRIYDNQWGDIDHFRPKGAIRDASGEHINLQKGAVKKKHPGYYWLAYDWENLLPTCQLCNQPSTRRSDGRSIGKHDYFPLEDETARATGPGGEVGERPLFIHPVKEDPGEYLLLDVTGVFAAEPESGPRGEFCITRLGLNNRGLPSERAQVYHNVMGLFVKLVQLKLEDPSDPKIAEVQARLDMIEAGYEEFTSAARLALKHARERLKSILEPEF